MAGNVKVRFSVQGGPALIEALNELGRGARNRVLRQALAQGAKPILETAKQLVPVETGLLRRSLGTKSKTYKSNGVIVLVIGPRSQRYRVEDRGKTRRGKRFKVSRVKPGGTLPPVASGVKISYRNPAKYSHLVERGTKRSRAKPFMRPAFLGNKALAETIITEEIRRGIQREAVRAAKKQAAKILGGRR